MLHEHITDAIIGAFYRVYRALGSGMSETLYQRALMVELARAGLDAESEIPIRVYYRGTPIGDYRLDVLVQLSVLVECKAAACIHPSHKRQLWRYLRITGLEAGLVLNFGPTPSVARVANTGGGRDDDEIVEFRRRDDPGA